MRLVHDVDVIVTRDVSKFINAEVPIALPEDGDTVNCGERRNQHSARHNNSGAAD